MRTLTVSIDSSRPIFVEAAVPQFGEIFAAANSEEQAAILQVIAVELKKCPMQLDYIWMELKRPEFVDGLEFCRHISAPETEAETL